MSHYRFDLTPRQQQILEMMADGKSDKEIAQTVGIARQTLKNYVSGKEARKPKAIYNVMGVKDRTQAVVAYLGWRSLKQRGLA